VAAAPFKVTVGLVPVTLQLSTELPPAEIVGADAVKLAITGAVAEEEGLVAAGCTMTVVLFRAVPPGPVAVRVKVVVLLNVVEPESLVAGTDAVCAPFDKVAEVAPCNI
jgi:hypothetical protein